MFDILTCLFFILSFFFKRSKYQKIQSIIIITILLSLTNNNPKRHRTRHAPSNSSIPSLYSFSYFRFSHPYLFSLRLLGCVAKEVQLLTVEYTSGCNLQKTTCILAGRVRNCDCPQKLTSYATIFHSSPNCHPSLLCCGDCLIKFY